MIGLFFLEHAAVIILMVVFFLVILVVLPVCYFLVHIGFAADSSIDG
jgi:hypothetical protein